MENPRKPLAAPRPRKRAGATRGQAKLTCKTEWFSILIILAVIAIAIWAYPQLPEQVPSHWGVTGEVDGWTTPLGHTLMFPGIILGLYLLFLALPYLEPRRTHFIKSWGFYSILKNFMVAFLGLLFIATTWAGISATAVPIGTIVPLSVGLLFVLIGNYMPQIKSNFLMGIRTPWTLSSETVWQKTHRLGAYTFTIGGLLFMTTPWMPVPYNAYVPMVGILIAALLPVVMSFIWFKQGKN